MQRKPGFPVSNCNIKMPDGAPSLDLVVEEDGEQVQRRQQLINFGHSQWGFNNWSWSVTKQELDFVDYANGKYCAGVVAFVSITVKSFDIHRENIGYATSLANNKGAAIYKSRKCAVTNALRETLLSFGGSVASELMESLETHKSEAPTPAPEPEIIQNVANKHSEPKNAPLNRNIRKDSFDSGCSTANNIRQAPAIKNAPPPPAVKAPPAPAPPPVRPPPAPLPPRAPPCAPRNPNVSVVVGPWAGSLPPPLYAPPPRLPPPHLYPYYEYSGPWHFTYETYDLRHGNVDLNFNVPPKNLVVNGRGSVECKNMPHACGVRQDDQPQYPPPPQNQGCWIKPTIFYDGFWTEQKVNKWVAEQREKHLAEDASQKCSSPSNGQADS